MKRDEKTNVSAPEKKRMTLRDYFKSLPDANTIAPKKELAERVAQRCDVPVNTARSWMLYGNQPRRNRAHVIQVLHEETGIDPEDMWD